MLTYPDDASDEFEHSTLDRQDAASTPPTLEPPDEYLLEEEGLGHDSSPELQPGQEPEPEPIEDSLDTIVSSSSKNKKQKKKDKKARKWDEEEN